MCVDGRMSTLPLLLRFQQVGSADLLCGVTLRPSSQIFSYTGQCLGLGLRVRGIVFDWLAEESDRMYSMVTVTLYPRHPRNTNGPEYSLMVCIDG